jgi:hypothetical protein
MENYSGRTHIPQDTAFSIIDFPFSNSNFKLGFTIKRDTAGLKGYAGALAAQGTINRNPGDGLFAPQFKGITW